MSLLLILLVVMVTSACSPAKPAGENKTDTPELTKVRLAIDTAAGGSFQFRVAKDKGFFAKYGVDAETSNFAYGIDTVNALLIGQADTALAADYALINSLSKGNMVVVSALTRTNEKSATRTILFAKDTINKPEDLRGKKLGVQKGTVYEYVWAKYLEKNNIAANAIQYVPFSTPDEAIVSLQKGDMDAVWIGGALINKFKNLKQVKQLATVLDSGVNISSYLLLDASFVKQNPNAVAAVLKALDEGIRYIPDHVDETAALAFKELKLPKDSVAQDLQYTNYALGFSQEDFDHLQNVKNWAEKNGVLKASYDLKDKINSEILKQTFPDRLTYKP
jgi:ABC-type nitrate/sulfonate/bicarbonate transport system substrate-binding protein